jgi:hypothetical protein
MLARCRSKQRQLFRKRWRSLDLDLGHPIGHAQYGYGKSALAVLGRTCNESCISSC